MTTKPIRLTILGEPKAQKRHRTVKMGSFNRNYDPSAPDKADFLSLVHANAPSEPIKVPVMVEVEFFLGRPKSHFRTGKYSHILKDDAPMWHTSKPDCDNLFKFVSDALNGIYWRDDSMIAATSIRKVYSVQPRTVIVITPL